MYFSFAANRMQFQTKERGKERGRGRAREGGRLRGKGRWGENESVSQVENGLRDSDVRGLRMKEWWSNMNEWWANMNGGQT